MLSPYLGEILKVSLLSWNLILYYPLPLTLTTSLNSLVLLYILISHAIIILTLHIKRFPFVYLCLTGNWNQQCEKWIHVHPNWLGQTQTYTPNKIDQKNSTRCISKNYIHVLDNQFDASETNQKRHSCVLRLAGTSKLQVIKLCVQQTEFIYKMYVLKMSLLWNMYYPWNVSQWDL